MIEAGRPWGWEATLPADAPVVGSDRELAQLLAAHRTGSPPVVGLAGGDLCRSLGGRGDVAERRGRLVRLMPVDAVEVHLDDADAGVFVAHLAAHRRLWRGRFLVVMNADLLGEWSPAPRAHPGDGLLDSISGSLRWRERLRARDLARSGDHLPHPDLSTHRGPTVSWVSDHPIPVILDGARVGRHRRIDAQVVPHAAEVAV